ncbi:alpha/beta hydrolase [Phenylobacterium sp.]|uniref:alpha/beta hydrolase n=1 Tax=Phenylobacterium sp. TaxID=1871053 RepID=UPI0025F44392|nr:alpha/beta hydrolase [Phenylobacterium sp.]
MTALRLLAAILGGLLASAASAAPAPRDINIQIIGLPSDPPGRTLLAPGGGRDLSPAILFTPAAGPNVYGPAIVMLSTGPGSNPGRSDEPSRFAAERLARRGYTVLSLYSHLERGYPLNRFEQTRYDISAALDLLERMGFEDLVLAGRGYGAIAAANYLAESDDAALATPDRRRVRAAVLIDPLTDVRAFVSSGLSGPDYDAKVAQARVDVAAGRGLIPGVVEPGYHPPEHDAPWVVAGRYAMPAEAFLNYFGPEAQARNLSALSRIPIPTLGLVSAGDPSSSTTVLKDLKPARPGTLAIQSEPAGDFDTPAVQDRLTDDLAAWLAKQGLGVRPAVRTSFASIRAADGQIFTGVLYAPMDGGKDRPAFILHHGLSEDTIHSSTHWLGWRLAQAGYASLSVANHSSGVTGATMTGTLAEVADDTGRWADWLAAQGYPRLILQGHSNGGVLISNYMSLTHDRRVVGMVYMAPTLDTPRFARETLGAAVYAQQVDEAKAAIARGEGDTHLMTQDKLRFARRFLDTSGPDSRATHTERIKEFDTPMLVIAGAADPLMTRDPTFIESFVRNHPGPSEVHWYEGGSHGMKESKDRVRDDIVAWTRKMFGAR